MHTAFLGLCQYYFIQNFIFDVGSGEQCLLPYEIAHIYNFVQFQTEGKINL
jgi:hypothetical protein